MRGPGGRKGRGGPRSLGHVTALDRTPADLLRSALATDPARPFVTYYDDATGERVELSVATFANWVAKTANLIQGELSLSPGDRLALHLPAHWQSAVWLVAASSTGLLVDVAGDPARADLVVTGPDSLEAARACTGERVALSLRPLGVRFPVTPEGFLDYAVEVPAQGDRFAPFAPVDPEEPALVVAGEELTSTQLVERAQGDAERLGVGPGERILSGLGFADWAGLAAGLYAPLAVGASVVLCRHVDRGALERRMADERVTVSAV